MKPSQIKLGIDLSVAVYAMMLWFSSKSINIFQFCSVLLYFLLLSSVLVWISPSHKFLTNQPAQPQEQEGCAPIHIFAARGSGEPAGLGAVGRLAGLIQHDNLSMTTVEAIDYPALLDPNDPTRYAFSSYVGVSAVMWQVTDYYNRCPDSKFVLLGYSQVRVIY